MPRCRQRKCGHCGQLYEPDPRNRYHQRYCSEPACRQASKTASQRRWRASPKGRDYFGGSANVLRVQAWRKAHPGYWRRRRKPLGPPSGKSSALQDHCLPQALVPPKDKPGLTQRALQDVIITQGLTLTGLVAQLTPRPCMRSGTVSRQNPDRRSVPDRRKRLILYQWLTDRSGLATGLTQAGPNMVIGGHGGIFSGSRVMPP